VRAIALQQRPVSFGRATIRRAEHHTMLQRLLPLVLCLSWAHAGFAQQRGVFASLGAGAARVDSITGIAVNATIVARTHWVQIVVTPIEFVSYSGGRASLITGDIAGNGVCKNPLRGAVGARQTCVGTSALYGASASVGVRVAGTPAFIGLGSRASSGRPATYGTVVMSLGTWHALPVSATAQVGARYSSAVVSIGYRLTRGRPPSRVTECARERPKPGRC
jgi:hypothetical protein